MSKPPVIALWLDSADPDLLEDLLAAGALPHLARLRAGGAYGRLHSIRFGVTEVSYAMLGTGCWPSTLGYWQQCDFDPATYVTGLAGLGHFERHRPFYALGPDHRVVFFDVPQMPVRDDVQGLQLASWGSHAAHVPRGSRPEGLLADILARHGLPPMEHQSGYEPDDADSLRGMHRALLEGLARREAVLIDLWRRAGGRRWDLFFTAVAETHTAGHALWPHAELRAALAAAGGDRLLTEVYSRADALVGRLVAEAGPDAQVAIFSVEGVRGNHMDNGSMLFLPEFMMRYSFAGEPVFDFDAPPAHEPPPDGLAGWYFHVWRHRVRPGPLGSWLRRHLAPARAAAWEARLGLGPSPYPAPPDEERYLPATWFEPYFPHMKGFALPGFSDGFVRLNVRGRERHGRVPAKAYGRVCDEITALLRDLVDEHGRAVVEEVIRTRRHAGESGPGVPTADLVIRWSPHCGREVRSPRLGRLGPTLPPRLGSHTAHGFLVARGPGFVPGSTLPDARVVDLAPTLLAMVGAPAPAMDGRSLLDLPSVPAPRRPAVLLRDPGPPEPRPARLAMVVCVRNEEDFLLANLLYHRALGVERAYVYLDRCDDRSAELASRLVEVRLFEVAPAERARFEYVGDFQAACMTHALGPARAEGFAWLLAVDADEFASGVDRWEAPAAGDALAACDLRRLVTRVPPESLQVLLATKECVPADLGEPTPFWCQPYFQAEPVPRQLHDPVTGETRVWTEFLGHNTGKPLLRATANAQAFHPHRWVRRQASRPVRDAAGRLIARRLVDDPLPSIEAGSLYHFSVVNARHWRAKYTKIADEPSVWSSGHPVEFLRACWKRASQALDSTEAVAYFAKWVALPEKELAALHAAGRLTCEATVEAVLRASGSLDGDRLLIPSGQRAGRMGRPEPVTLLPDLEAARAHAAADGMPRRRWRRWVRGRGGGTGPPSDLGVYRMFPADLSRSNLRGFHPIEAIAGEAFCWAMPEAAVRLTLPPGDYEVLVHTRQLAGLWAGRLGAALGDGPLRSCEPMDAAGVVRFHVRATDFPVGESWLHLAAPRVETTGWPGGEWRDLGLPIFEITFSAPAPQRARTPA